LEEKIMASGADRKIVRVPPKAVRVVRNVIESETDGTADRKFNFGTGNRKFAFGTGNRKFSFGTGNRQFSR
jgi:hypothetical protein